MRDQPTKHELIGQVLFVTTSREAKHNHYTISKTLLAVVEQ